MRQVRIQLIRPVPALESVLCRVTQLVNGLGDPLPELDEEPNCSDAVLIGIHELLRVVQKFHRTPQRQLVIDTFPMRTVLCCVSVM